MHQAPAIIENVPFAEISLGQQASLTRTLTWRDIELFAVVSGDINPMHLDPGFAATGRFHHLIAHGMWGATLISALLGTRLPGPGTIYLSQELKFLRPVSLGDTVTATVTVIEMEPTHRRVQLDCRCVDQERNEVIAGRALVIAPQEKLIREAVQLPAVTLSDEGAAP
jgi:acyl dehydratase